MAPVYTKRFMAAKALAAQISAVVPTGKVWVLKDIEWCEMSGQAGTGMIVTAADGRIVIAQHASAAYDWKQWTGTVAFNAGETIYLRSNVGSIDVTVTGFELTMAA
jgi:hypothetical protein